MLSTGTGNRPNRVCDGRLDNPTIDRWFDLSCFVPTADNTGTYGDSGRGVIRGPGSFNIDASLIKNTRFGGVTTEIRIEAFNILNHPQFANPNTHDRERGRGDDLGKCSRARRARSAARSSVRYSSV